LLAFVLRRVLQSLAVMAVVAFIAFGLFNFTGDPVAFMLTQQDIPVMAACLCFIALVFVLLNLIVDLLYYAVDPRLRVERGAAH